MDKPLVTATFNHAAFVVSSIDRSITFYRRLFGGEIEIRIDDIEDDAIAQLHGLESARFDLVYLRYGSARLELFEFHEPAAGEPRLPAANEIGAAHIAFEIDDVAAAYDRLRGEGIDFTRPPVEVAAGEGETLELAFIADPDGNRIELISRSPRSQELRPARVVIVSVVPDQRNAFLELMEPVVAATKAEAGSEDYGLHEEEGAPNTFWIYERYVDRDAVERHEEQPVLKEMLAAVGPMMSGEPRQIELTTHSAI